MPLVGSAFVEARLQNSGHSRRPGGRPEPVFDEEKGQQRRAPSRVARALRTDDGPKGKTVTSPNRLVRFEKARKNFGPLLKPLRSGVAADVRRRIPWLCNASTRSASLRRRLRRGSERGSIVTVSFRLGFPGVRLISGTDAPRHGA